VIELSPHDHLLPGQTYGDLRHEIGQYDASILEKPSLIALNKVDLLEDQEELELIMDSFYEAHPTIDPNQVFIISADQQQDLAPLRERIVEMFTEHVSPPQKGDNEPYDPFAS
jgi:GTP-binding protein